MVSTAPNTRLIDLSGGLSPCIQPCMYARLTLACSSSIICSSFTTMVDWAERFAVPIYLHESLRPWVMRPSERITFWSGETHTLMDDMTLVRPGGHFTGSTVLHWPHGAEGKGLLLTGDTIQVVPDRRWVSFMYSYPNLIPLPASEIRRMREAILPYNFERLYGSFGGVVASDAKNAVLRSADRYIRALSERL